MTEEQARVMYSYGFGKPGRPPRLLDIRVDYAPWWKPWHPDITTFVMDSGIPWESWESFRDRMMRRGGGK